MATATATATMPDIGSHHSVGGRLQRRIGIGLSGCFAASSSGTRLGYYVSTAILSLTPLLIIGLGVGYISFKRSQTDCGSRIGQSGPR